MCYNNSIRNKLIIMIKEIDFSIPNSNNNDIRIKDDGCIRGDVEVIITKKDGTVIHDRNHNIIVNAGIALIAKRSFSNVDPATYLAIGGGTTAASATDTQLESEFSASGLERKNITPTSVTTTVTDDSVLFDATWYPTSSGTVSEVGIFNAAAGGDMVGRRVFTGRYVENGDNIRIRYKVILA